MTSNWPSRSRRWPASPFFDRIVSGKPITAPKSPTDLRGYVELALAGGFPQTALGGSERARRHWLDSYIDQLVTRDAAS